MLNLHIAKTREAAMVKGRPGQDEFNKFLSPYGRFSSYRNPDGSKVAFNHCPTVEESNEQKIQIVGSIDDAVDAIGYWRDLLDLKHICFFFDYPGLTTRRDERADAPRRRGGLPSTRRTDRAPPDHGLTAGVKPMTPAAQDLADDGYLLLPAFAEPHAHLDKAFLAERVENPTGDLLGAILAMDAARETITLDDTIERAERAARLLAANGCTAIRTHVDLMPGRQVDDPSKH